MKPLFRLIEINKEGLPKFALYIICWKLYYLKNVLKLLYIFLLLLIALELPKKKNKKNITSPLTDFDGRSFLILFLLRYASKKRNT